MLGPLLFLRPFLQRTVTRTGYTVLSPKRGNKHYYKGKGAASTGRHTRKGGYELLEHKLPNFAVPDLAGFELKPYVSYSVPRNPAPKATPTSA